MGRRKQYDEGTRGLEKEGVIRVGFELRETRGELSAATALQATLRPSIHVRSLYLLFLLRQFEPQPCPSSTPSPLSPRPRACITLF